MRCRRGQGQGLDLGWVGDLGWGGVGLGSWGWAFSFLCFGIVECAHGHAYAKQVRIMCVLSVPLLDQVSGRTESRILAQAPVQDLQDQTLERPWPDREPTLKTRSWTGIGLTLTKPRPCLLDFPLGFGA